MENYHLVSQWAASLNGEKALKELLDFKAKSIWGAKQLPETTTFLAQMVEDLPRILHIVVLQEKQNAILRKANERLHGYITANNMADEVIIDDIRKKFNIDI